MAAGGRLLAGASALPARPRGDLPGRVPRHAPSVPASPRRARAAAGAGVPRGGPFHGVAEHLSLALLRPLARDRVLDRSRAGGCGRARCPRSRADADRDARVVRAVGAVPVHRQRRADLLLVRLGDAALRDRIPRHLPRQRAGRADDPTRVPDPLAPLPRGVRRWADQDARRSMLARPHLPVLPPRDAANAQPAVLVLPPRAEALPSVRGPRESFRAAG